MRPTKPEFSWTPKTYIKPLLLPEKLSYVGLDPRHFEARVWTWLGFEIITDVWPIKDATTPHTPSTSTQE